MMVTLVVGATGECSKESNGLMICIKIGHLVTMNRPLFDKGFKNELTLNLTGIDGLNLKKLVDIYIIVIDNVISMFTLP